MKTSQTIKIDLLTPGARPRIHAVQDDICTREVKILLYAGGVSWGVLDGLNAAVGYSKPDCTVGLYDTLSDGSKAVSISGNTVTVILAAQMLTAAGTVEAAVTLADGSGNQISTFAFDVIVSVNPGSSAVKSEDYFNYVNPKIQAVIEQAAAATTAANAAASRANTSAELAEGAHELADAANQKVDTLREVVSKLHSNIVEDASGEVITVSDSAEAPLQGLKVFGKTEQRTTTGKNLLGINYKIITIGNFELICDHGYVTAKGTVPNYAVSAWLAGEYTLTQPVLTLPAGTYTITNCTLFSFDGTNRNQYTGTCTFTTPLNVTGILYKQFPAGTVVNETAYLQIEKGSLATEWEPYTGGAPSPSPEYPQALESVIDGGSMTVTAYKNLLDRNMLVYDYAIRTATGEVYVLGTGSYYATIEYLPVYFGGQILASSRTTFAFYDSSKQFIRVVASTNFTVPENAAYYRVEVHKDYKDTAYFYEEVAATTATVTPVDSSGNSLYLPGLPVASGGNYTDPVTGKQWICDEVDFEKGVYVQRVKRRILLASDMWLAYADGKRYWIDDAEINKANVCAICTHYQRVDSWANHMATDGSFVVHRDPSWNYGRISFIDNRITSLDGWKQFLNANEVTIIYAKEKENRIPLTGEELAAFASMQSHYPNTTVFNDAGAHMALKYVADTKKYVDKKFAELAAALVSST